MSLDVKLDAGSSLALTLGTEQFALVVVTHTLEILGFPGVFSARTPINYSR
ncbi:hypothetical protein IQ246_28945 [aff. Roholtiella sp. LEGE 12411]|nr:hypothetical protein [aff. Roholtiella sp. LEGE 12411]